MTRDTQPVTKAAAATALRAAGAEAAAHGVHDCGPGVLVALVDSEPGTRTLRLAYVEQATSIEWVPHLLHHDLKVLVPGDRAVYFDVPRPGRPT